MRNDLICATVHEHSTMPMKEAVLLCVNPGEMLREEPSRCLCQLLDYFVSNIGIREDGLLIDGLR